MDKSWKSALFKLCEIYFQSDIKIEWILVGSVGSVLQGCEMEPGDIDIYVKDKESVSQFAELLSEFSLPAKSEKRHVNDWLSSEEEPIFNQTFPSGFTWTKGRWNVDGFKVEVVHISDSAGIPDSLTGDGIWEGGKYIWSYCKNVKFGEYTIPTIPLEIQLESNIRRKRQERIDSILNTIIKNGCDEELIKKALSSRNITNFHSKINLQLDLK